MKKMSTLDWIGLILLVVGGLNWGLVGFFNFNLVGFLFGQASFLARAIYALVGLSAIYVAFMPALLGSSDETSYMSGRPAARSM